MKTIIAALVGAVSAFDAEFMMFVAEHGKSYGTVEEFEFRMNLWKETDAVIKAHKSDSYELGHNHMSDWTSDEYSRLLGYKEHLREDVQEPTILETNGDTTHIDWRDKGAVTPVKDQK